MATSTVRVTIAYYSGSGHTQRQAEAVAHGAATVPGTNVSLYNVADLNDALWLALDRSDAIIFGAPTYMGSPAALFKLFAEQTSKIWADNMRWKDKIAAGFTNSQNIHGDKQNTLHAIAALAAQHGMHWVNLGLYPGWNTSKGSAEDINRLGSFIGAMAQSNGDEGPDLAPPKSDLLTAEALGRRVALVTWQLVRGRESLAALPLASQAVSV